MNQHGSAGPDLALILYMIKYFYRLEITTRSSLFYSVNKKSYLVKHLVFY